MSNEDYYKYEKSLIQAIMNGEPDIVRGALAGVVRNNQSADFVRQLGQALQTNSDPISKFRSSLRDLHRATP